jgi:L-arabinose transport system substrate-binding protein
MKIMTKVPRFFGVVALALFVGCGPNGSPNSGNPGSPLSDAAAGKIKIGFIVKQPEEPWFQLEWRFAQQAADANKFELVKIGAVDGEKALAAIDNLAAQQAQGFVICTPDTRLGPAIAAKARAAKMKLLTVDDQFLGADGKPMADVHHLGISARNIGHMVGKALAAEMKKRGWSAAETALCAVTFEELATAGERTDGAIESIVEAGFAKEKIFKVAQKTSDVPGAFDAANILLTQHPEVKRWLICGMNDSAVMGAVRAMEGRGFSADNVVGIGINGSDDCISEFKKPKPTGFHASVLLSAKRHGQETAEMMFKWIKDGVEPAKATYTDGVLITRDTYERILKEQGL